MHIFHGACRIVFASSGFLLVAEDRDDPFGCWQLHAKVCLVDDCREVNNVVATEDGVVRVADVYHIEGYGLRPLCVALAEGHIQFGLAEGLYFLSTEADERVLGLV